MKILFVLIPLSLLLLVIAVWGLFWMVRHRQFEDLDAASWQVLIDEKEPGAPHD